MSVTHVTDWALAKCAGVLLRPGDSAHPKATKARMKRRGLLINTVACDGSAAGGRYRARINGKPVGRDVIGMASVAIEIPTCPRCAVMRDEALEGRLPKR